MDWGGANSRFLGLVSVWAARSFDQTALRPSVIKRIRQIDVKYIAHITQYICNSNIYARSCQVWRAYLIRYGIYINVGTPLQSSTSCRSWHDRTSEEVSGPSLQPLPRTMSPMQLWPTSVHATEALLSVHG